MLRREVCGLSQPGDDDTSGHDGDAAAPIIAAAAQVCAVIHISIGKHSGHECVASTVVLVLERSVNRGKILRAGLSCHVSSTATRDDANSILTLKTTRRTAQVGGVQHLSSI